MKYHLLFIGVVAGMLPGCVSSRKAARDERRVYVGQNRAGYLTFNDAVYRGSKANLENLREESVAYHATFLVPEDVFLNPEKQMYAYKLTQGVTVYRRDKETFQWARVTFIPSSQQIQAIESTGIYISITIKKEKDQKVTQLQYQWRPANANYGERYVLL